MLKLHSLDITGFKSFSDTVQVRFADGITAIVGPNGCGKSNLTDAITWVLGEQSPKSLRGAKMEDIIFNGSSKRKPLGMAEVSLTLLSDPSFDRAVDGKIVIGRRVFRAGGSQYRLNGKVVRLKEIKDLLMDTGLGIRAYSVIEQGKIGMILSGKPHERRKLLEEAAGITRYKERKRIAEIKLEEALGNLLRLDDIISEVNRALRSLKRQASTARRYKKLQTDYRDLLKQVLLGRWSLLSTRLTELTSELAERTDGDAALAADLHRDEAALAEGRETLDVHSRELAARHQAQADLAATIEGRQEFLKGARQRSEEMQERLTRGHTQAAERRQQTSDFRSSLGHLDERTQELLAERDEAARQVAEDEARISAAQRNVEQAQARLESLRQEMLSAVNRVNQLRANLQREQVEIEKRTYRKRFLGEEHERLARQLDEATATLRGVDEKIAAAEADLEAKTQTHRQLDENLEGVLRREAELGDERRQLENRIQSLEQRQRILVELSQEHAERRETLVAKLGEIGLEAPRFLAETVAPAEGWEEGIDHFLGDLADAVLLEPHQDALELARALSRLDTSAIFLRPLTSEESLPEVEDEALSYSLAEALDLPPELARALPPAYLVGSPEDALRLAAEHPGTAFISRERLWVLGGALRVQAEEAAPGVLARKSEIEAIREELPTSRERLQQTRQTLDSLVSERTRLAKEKNRLEEALAALRRDIAVAQARRQDAVSRHEKLDTQMRTVVEEQTEIAVDLEEKAVRREEQRAKLAEAETYNTGLTESFEACQAEVEAAKDEREALRTAGAGRRGRLELLDERLQSHNQESVRVRRQITYTEEQLVTWSQEGETLERRLHELAENIEQAEQHLQEALDQRSQAQERVLEQQAVLDQHRADLRTLEERVQELREQRETLRGKIEALRIDQAGLRQDSEHLSVTYREEFNKAIPGTLPPPTAEEENAEDMAEENAEGMAEEQAATAEHQAPAEATEGGEGGEGDAPVKTADGEAGDAGGAENGEEEEEAPFVLVEDEVEIPQIDRSHLAHLEADLARAKISVERIGPVNVLAAEEFDEQQERFGFLTAQRKDVAESVESLKLTILEINETSSERFRETFHQVNEVFGQTFNRLFRGGEAQMRLYDEEDILETGIEIMARPPGKRAQNITLLSGGEKALTAIALLFALFQSKPSPFCILDEVDAPLDDVNVLRFVETLQEMAQDTQFLVVSHNKLTMEVASYLYGVTMEEKGVSKLVSVEMAQMHPELTEGAA